MDTNVTRAPWLLWLVPSLLAGCSAGGESKGSSGAEDPSELSSSDAGGEAALPGTGVGPTTPGAGLPTLVDAGAPSDDPDGAATAVTIVETLPDQFSPADPEHPETSKGGYQVLGPLADVAAPEGECANVLRVIIRDFQGAHDDFENAGDWSRYEVQSPIGEIRKPQKTSTNGPLRLEDWYQNLEGINLPFAVDLWLEPVGETFVFDSTAFFPLRDLGFMDAYLFTTELHTNFEYKGGEVFTFRGDDDVFVFINGHLAVNLSGVHDAQEGSVDLDEQAAVFGIEVGNVYTFDLFQAERQPSGSNFRLETTLDFTGCGVILPIDEVR